MLPSAGGGLLSSLEAFIEIPVPFSVDIITVSTVKQAAAERCSLR